MPNSVLRVLADNQGALCHLKLQYLDWLARQLLPDTAETEWLDRHGDIWLVNADGTTGRKLATLAAGTVSFHRHIAAAWCRPGRNCRARFAMPAGSGSPNVAVTFETPRHRDGIGSAGEAPVRALDAGIVRQPARR